MANSYQGTPPVWIIDTASATPVSTDYLRIDQIVWEAGTGGVAGDECKITDASGSNIIFDVFGTGADYESFPRKFQDKSMNVRGLAVPTLAHGKVYIYLK